MVSKEQEEEYGTMGMAASGFVVTVRHIIQSCQHNVELLAKLEPIIFPMVVTSLSPDGCECLDEAMECITSMMNYTKTVTDRMWSLFPHMIKIGNYLCTNLSIVIGAADDNEGGYAFDYFTSMEDYFKGIIKFGNHGMMVKKIGEEPIMLVLVKGLVRILQITREEDVNTNAYI